MSDFLQRISTLLATAPAERPAVAEHASLLAPPMEALTETRSFSEVYGADDRLFSRLAEDADAGGDHRLAALLRDLEDGLADGSLQAPGSPEPVRRFSGFVYPVI